MPTQVSAVQIPVRLQFGGNNTVEPSEYALEPLRQDDQFILYRGRSAGADPTQILMLGPASAHPGPETLRRIDHEYSLRAELDMAWTAQPLAPSHYNGQPVLVLRDPGGDPLDRLFHGPIEIPRFLRIALGLATALKHLHQRQLTRKDIKPSNILVAPSSDQIWLTGFGIASRAPRERQPPTAPEFIAGTLPYMAPEQTGRMNRSIDSRSDLYSMGVVLYEMLTGTLPFAASDPMELVHAHIARQPVQPHERSKDIPGPVSGIVMKLLAKTAEERYQTAAGVESDLRHCLAEWEAQRRIGEFPLGEHDTPDRLLIPEKLYGRARDVETLLTSFDRIVKSGAPELVLVSGYSGIGKSAVVNELHRPLVPPRGLFASPPLGSVPETAAGPSSRGSTRKGRGDDGWSCRSARAVAGGRRSETVDRDSRSGIGDVCADVEEEKYRSRSPRLVVRQRTWRQ